MENPSLEDLLALKRIELIALAGHLGVSIKKYLKKQQSLDEIIVNLVDNEMLEEEKQEKREKKRTTERKTEKICELGVFGRTSDFNIIIGGLDFNILERRFGTRNFVLQV